MYVREDQCGVPLAGLGCASCEGSCGMGNYLTVKDPVSSYRLTSSGTGFAGLGLFDSMDFSTWGFSEWAIAAVGAYLVISLVGDVGRGSRAVRKYSRKKASTARRRKELQDELKGLK